MSSATTPEASEASPPPLPDEPLPAAAGPGGEPAAELEAGPLEDDGEGKGRLGKGKAAASRPGDDGEVQDEDEESDDVSDSDEKGGDAEGTDCSAADDGEGLGGEGDRAQLWQAVWAPEQNAYYFWHTETGEVTWTNPLAPASNAPPLPSEPAPVPAPTALRPAAAAAAQPTSLPSIDPALAYLLPPEQRGGPSDPTAQAASFNARTGRFAVTGSDYAISHLDEYNRMRRFNEHYFDVDAWERERAAEQAKRKRDEEAGVGHAGKITRKDMDRFRRKAAEKKVRKQAWLRD
ncbi:hypothetical protein Q5752_003066 [Cryptotrichosporon argae]